MRDMESSGFVMQPHVDRGGTLLIVSADIACSARQQASAPEGQENPEHYPIFTRFDMPFCGNLKTCVCDDAPCV
jgi:hypothetical protein